MKTLKLLLMRTWLTAWCGWAASASAQDSGNVIPFQGQLANQAGEPLLSAKAVTLVFRLYRAPVGNVAIWEESQPNISVNAGRFSVLLGSRTELPSYTNFNATLYLGITVDDGDPATTDVEMRPRQAFVPVVSARYAQNADKLNGFDWSALFGVNNPSGKINGAKIAEGTITAATILSNTITAAQIAKNSVTGAEIATNTLTKVHLRTNSVVSEAIGDDEVKANNIATNAVGSLNIQQSSVTFEKLAGRETGTNVVGIGGVAVSDVAGPTGLTQEYNSDLVPELKVTIRTTGRPVLVMLTVGEKHADHPWGSLFTLSNESRQAWFVRDGVQEYESILWSGVTYSAPSTVTFLDWKCPAGLHVYQLGFYPIRVSNVRLVVFEL